MNIEHGRDASAQAMTYREIDIQPKRDTPFAEDAGFFDQLDYVRGDVHISSSLISQERKGVLRRGDSPALIQSIEKGTYVRRR
jgi:hypothetical protein